MLNVIVNLLIVITLFFSIGFVSVYATSPWKMNNLGKATMTWGMSMIVWCIAGLVYSFAGPTWYYPWLRLAAYSSTAWAMGTMLYNLIKVQRQVIRELDEDQDKTPVG